MEWLTCIMFSLTDSCSRSVFLIPVCQVEVLDPLEFQNRQAVGRMGWVLGYANTFSVYLSAYLSQIGDLEDEVTD